MFYGSMAALITPFSGGHIDTDALAGMVHFHLDNGTHGIVPVGTTGEASTLSHQEHARVVDTVVREVAGRIPVLAGAGSNNPNEAMALADSAADSGADGVLHVMGYYNRPGQDGIYRHFAALNETTRLPIVVYNVPPRTIIDIEPVTMGRIAALANVIGVKDATRDLSRPLLERQLIHKDFCFLSGEDPTAVAYNVHGGGGCISVTANVAPQLCADLQQACIDEDFGRARDIQLRLMPLHTALFMEPSPSGVKYACSLLGLCDEYCRLPMVPLTQPARLAIESAMRELELIH